MSARRPASDDIQPAQFAFNPANAAWVKEQIAKYPAGRQASAVIPLLWQAQKQAGGWLPRAAIEHVAEVLEMPNIRVMEVATFYTMFNLAPEGQYFIQLCGTVPCHCVGAPELRKLLEKRIGAERHVTPDGKFSWLEVECLGACCNAPMAQINEDYFEDLTPDILDKLMDDLSAGKPVKIGPQNGRKASEPKDNIRTLLDKSLYDGSLVGSWQKAFEARAEAQKKAKEEAAKTAEAAKVAQAANPAGGPAPATSAPAAPSAAAIAASPTLAAPSRPVKSAGSGASNSSEDTPASGGSGATAKGSAGQAANPVGTTAASALNETALKAEEAEIEKALSALPKNATAEQKADAVGTRPEGLAEARQKKPDKLQQIKGIGPVNESKLNGLGIFHFDQIAAWDRPKIRWVGTYLSFPGRIDRENWIAQAANLAAGGKPLGKA